MDFVAALIGSAIGAVISGLIIWIIGKLNLGLEVENFGWAIIAGVLIAVLTSLIIQVLGNFNVITTGFMGAVIWVVAAASVIVSSGSFLKGLKVNGYTGALIAAVAIAVINYALCSHGHGLAPARHGRPRGSRPTPTY
jgi:putative membrane protein